jgi:putative intracellular protease/amidase
MNILMILVPDVGLMSRTLRLERFLGPYYAFREAGADIALASPEGGVAFDRSSPLDGVPLRLSERFAADREARESVLDTLRLEQVFPEDFAAAFCVGVSGPLWAAAAELTAGTLLSRFLACGKPVASIPSPTSVAPRGAADGVLISADAPGCAEAAAFALLAALRAPYSSDPRALGSTSP